MICKVCGKLIKKIHQNHEKSIRHQESLESIQLFQYLLNNISHNYLSKVLKKRSFFRGIKKPKYARTKFKKIDLLFLHYSSYKNKFLDFLLYLLPFNNDINSIIYEYIISDLWLSLLKSNNIVISYLKMEDTLSSEFTQQVFSDLELGVELVYCQKQLAKYHYEYFQKLDNWSRFVKKHNESINNIIYSKYNFIPDIYPKSRKRKWIMFINKLCNLNMNVSSIIIDYLWTQGIFCKGILCSSDWLNKLYHINTCLEGKYIYRSEVYAYRQEKLMIDLFGDCLKTLWKNGQTEVLDNLSLKRIWNGSKESEWCLIALIYTSIRTKIDMFYLNNFRGNKIK